MYLKSLTEDEKLTLNKTVRMLICWAQENSKVNAEIDQSPFIPYQLNIALLLTGQMKNPNAPTETLKNLSLEDISNRIQASLKFADDLFMQMIGALVSFKLNSDSSFAQDHFSKKKLLDAIVEVLKPLPLTPGDDFAAFKIFKDQFIMPITTGAFTVYQSLVNPNQFLDLQRSLASCSFQSKLDQLLWSRVLLGFSSDFEGDSNVEEIPNDLWAYGEDAEDELLDLVEEVIADYVDSNSEE